MMPTRYTYRIVLGLATLLFLSSGQVAKGQIKGQFSQYLNNPFIINPAATGIYDYFDFNLSYRQQWVGFAGAPTNYYFSGHTTLTKRPKSHRAASLRISLPYEYSNLLSQARRKVIHAVGGGMMSDQFGPFTQNMAFGNYASHFPLSPQLNMSLGLSAEGYTIKFDEDKVDLEYKNDNTFFQFNSRYTSKLLFDAVFGSYVYSKRFYAGYSVSQIMKGKVYYRTENFDPLIAMHHYLSVGYRIDIGEHWVFNPDIMAKYTSQAPISADLNFKFEYKSLLWAGVSYRHNDAVIGLFGILVSDLVKLSYSYDYTVSELTTYNKGTHEIILGIKPF